MRGLRWRNGAPDRRRTFVFQATGPRGGRYTLNDDTCHIATPPGGVFAPPGGIDCRGGVGNDAVIATGGLADSGSGVSGAGGDGVRVSGTYETPGTAGDDKMVVSDGQVKVDSNVPVTCLTGGSGRNVYSGGAGRDTIMARNRARDTTDCGPGRDVAIVDRNDRVKRCETVRRPRR